MILIDPVDHLTFSKMHLVADYIQWQFPMPTMKSSFALFQMTQMENLASFTIFIMPKVTPLMMMIIPEQPATRPGHQMNIQAE